jgi:hypothetical protein
MLRLDAVQAEPAEAVADDGLDRFGGIAAIPPRYPDPVAELRAIVDAGDEQGDGPMSRPSGRNVMA